jgi:LysM repeat protein
MKKWLDQFFYTPKYGKVTEKVFLTRMTASISMIVLCMAAMAFTAYAYFSHSVASGTNTLQAAHFDVDITITQNGAPVTVVRGGADSYSVALKKDLTYAVTVQSTPGSTVGTGFVLITAGQQRYFTQQVEKGTTLHFSLVPTSDMSVTLLPHWGTSSHYDSFVKGEDDAYYITAGEETSITALELTEDPDDAPQTTVPETTVPAVTVPETTAPATTVPETTAPETTVPETTLDPEEYVVQPGDYLKKIADMYGIAWEALQAYNEIEGDVIHPGQILRIPPADYKAPAATEPPATQPAPVTTVPVPPESTEPVSVVTTVPVPESVPETTDAPTAPETTNEA